MATVTIRCSDEDACGFIHTAAAQLQAVYGGVSPRAKKGVVIIDASQLSSMAGMLEQFDNAEHWDEIVHDEYNPVDISWEDFQSSMRIAAAAIHQAQQDHPESVRKLKSKLLR